MELTPGQFRQASVGTVFILFALFTLPIRPWYVWLSALIFGLIIVFTAWGKAHD